MKLEVPRAGKARKSVVTFTSKTEQLFSPHLCYNFPNFFFTKIATNGKKIEGILNLQDGLANRNPIKLISGAGLLGF